VNIGEHWRFKDLGEDPGKVLCHKREYRSVEDVCLPPGIKKGLEKKWNSIFSQAFLVFPRGTLFHSFFRYHWSLTISHLCSAQ
jgi:hypothetical protein